MDVEVRTQSLESQGVVFVCFFGQDLQWSHTGHNVPLGQYGKAGTALPRPSALLCFCSRMVNTPLYWWQSHCEVLG